MKTPGEQWIEEIYGQKHMVKNVSHRAGGVVCSHCLFKGVNWCSPSSMTCRYWTPCPIEEGYIKDLGVLNEDGFLPCPFCGKYPILCRWGDVFSYYVSHRCTGRNLMDIRTINFPTEQQAIDAWNRRA